MAVESYERSFIGDADPTECWRVLTNMDSVASWVGILHQVEEIRTLERYRAVLQDRLGPLRLKAALEVEVEVVELGSHVVVHAAGRDPQVNSQIKINAVLRLKPVDAGTEIHLSGSYQVTGRVASMGGGIIRKKAATILDQFEDNASAAFAATDSGTSTA